MSDSTSDDDALVPRLNALGGEHDRLETTGADLVDCSRIGTRAHARAEGDLTGGGLADTSLDDIAEVDLLDELRLDTRLLERVLQGNDTKLGGREGLQRTVDRSHRRPGRSDDDGFVTGLGGLWMSPC